MKLTPQAKDALGFFFAAFFLSMAISIGHLITTCSDSKAKTTKEDK